MSHCSRYALTGALLGVLLAPFGLGQSTFGSITGVVTDQSGAIVPQAQIKVTNAGTGAVREANSGETGVFNVPNLDIGAYSLRVGAAGFTTYERSGLNLRSNQVLNVNVELAVGAASSVVEVKATSPTITTETQDLSGSMGSGAVERLPLTSRHTGDAGVFSYTMFNTGVASVGGGVQPYVGGARVQVGNLPTMDGIAVMSYPLGANPVQPSLESVQEVTVVKAVGPAEFATAANVKVVSKSGTNELHGSAFWDYNGNSLNARQFFAAKVPFRVYNNFAARAGGPIKKNKLFFFATYEGSREAATTVMIRDVPIPAYRTGDFSSLLSKNTIIKDPLTGIPFVNNQIPTQRISSVSQKVQEFYYPPPNSGAVGALSSNWQTQQRGTTGFTVFDHFDLRGDYNISNRDTVFARVSWRRMPLYYTDVYPLDVTQLRRSKSGVLSWNHTISAAAVNEFRFGATFHANPYQINLIGTDLVKQFGIQGVSTIPMANAPNFSITGVSSLDLDASGDNLHNNPSTNFEFINNLSWTRGKHFFKFGFDAIRDRMNGGNVASSMYGTFNFTGIYSGLGYADFLLGIPQTSGLSVPNPPRDFRGTTWAVYAQDQYKATRSLTLNIGLRWQLAGPYFSKHGAMYSFNPSTGALVIPDEGKSKLNPFYPQNIPVVTASQAGYPADSLVPFNKTSLANLQPRIGFAYKLFGGDKSVIRGGYGIYANLIYSTLAVQAMLGGPFSGSVTYTNAIRDGAPLFMFPYAFMATGTTSTQNVAGANPNLKTPYTQQWNLSLEQQVGNMGLRLSYLGSRSVNLLYRRNLNQPAPGTTKFTTSSRAYPIYNQVIYIDAGGFENYNALEASVERKFGKNLTFDAGWTWAKDLTDTQEATPYAGQVLENQFNRAVEKTNSQNSVPHRLFAYALYSLPFGASQPLLSNSKGLVQHIFGGWETAWTMVAQSGRFFHPTFGGFDPSNTNTIGGRPDRIKNGNLSSGRSVSNWFDTTAFAIPGCPDNNPVCTSPANVGRFGNSAANILTGPRVFNLDFGLMKSFRLAEGKDLRFQMNMANAFNHPNFGTPRANISAASTLNTINSQVRAMGGQPQSRNIDFSLRFSF